MNHGLSLMPRMPRIKSAFIRGIREYPWSVAVNRFFYSPEPAVVQNLQYICFLTLLLHVIQHQGARQQLCVEIFAVGM
jgi:hypothetical protein